MNGWDGFHKSGRYDLKTDIFKAWNAQNMHSNEDRDPYLSTPMLSTRSAMHIP